MSDGGQLLERIFLEMGARNKLPEDLLKEAFALMMRDLYLPKGERDHFRSELKALLKLR